MSSSKKAKNWSYPRHKSFVSALRTSSAHWFKSKGFYLHEKMPYCLDKLDNWHKNIILTEVADYVNKIKTESEKSSKPFPLHKYLHHGLSSQAMLFNLIGPLITRNHLEPLTELLQKKGITGNFKKALFEYEDRRVFNEDKGQPTSIDAVLLDSEDNPGVFIESKLVEAEFGGCSIFKSGDCPGANPVNDLNECYLHFIGRKYWDLMDKHGFSEKLKNERICILVNYYQFFRETLLSIEKEGAFVLLYDERSPVFNCSNDNKKRGLIPLLLEFVPPQLHKKIVLITIQELLNTISEYPIHKDWVNEFKSKYGLNIQTPKHTTNQPHSSPLYHSTTPLCAPRYAPSNLNLES
jgi:hypothetical protein